MKNVGWCVTALVGMVLSGCAQPGEPSAASGVGGAGSGATSGSTGGASQIGAGGSGVGAGGSGSSTTQTTTSAISGSRLKAYWLTTSDGAQQFNYQWRDTQLNIDCAFGVASDGQWRCLPSAGSAASFFSDSGCTTPINVSPCGSATPGYLSVNIPASGCSVPATSKLYLRGAQYTGNVFEGSPSSCSNVTSALAATYTFYSVGSAVDVTTFAQATLGYQ